MDDSSESPDNFRVLPEKPKCGKEKLLKQWQKFNRLFCRAWWRQNLHPAGQL